MHMKFVSFVASAAIILAGCASQAKYPFTGKTVQATDAVPFMTAPSLAQY